MTADRSVTAKSKKGEKSQLSFKPNLFGVNWQFVNTCERSVCHTSLTKKVFSVSFILFTHN